MRDLFTGYYPPTTSELERLWADSLVIVDTNVLLNLYRYSEASREEFIGVLDALRERLWLPHQVALEFHKGRVGVINTQWSAFDQVIESLRSADVTLQNDVGKFRKIESLDLENLILRRTEMTDELVKNLESVKSTQTKIPNNPDDDSVAIWVTSTFENKVGPAFPAERTKKVFEDGARRYASNTPPGFADSKKPSDSEKFGDLVLWLQIIEHANQESKDVIFVTDDKKGDWWRIEHGQTLGPRPELISEFRDATSKRVQLYKPEQFLREAQPRFKAKVSTATFNEVEDVSASLGRERYLEDRREQAESIRRRSNPFRREQTVGSIKISRVLRNIELQERYSELEIEHERLQAAMNAAANGEDESIVIDAILDVRESLQQVAEELAADSQDGYFADEATAQILKAGRTRVNKILARPISE